MRILCTGANHRSAEVAIREKLAFDADQRARALRELRGHWPEAEFTILSTCNRSEVYAARPVHGHPRLEQLHEWLREFHALAPGEHEDALYCLADADAVGHLFAVASGLDSLVPGEYQIVSQVKDAYAQATAAQAAGPVMNELFQTALHVAKHVRTETNIATGKISVASVAVEFVRQLYETLADKCILNVGAGKMNELMLRQLLDLGGARIVVVNRSPEKAEALAEACGGRAGRLERLPEHLAEADVVLTSTGSPRPILSPDMVRAAQQKRGYRPLLIVDIAVPRDVAPEAGEIDNVFLYNIDDLEQVVQSNLAHRHQQRGPADTIIAEHVGELLGSLNVRNIQPTIRALYRRMEAIADQELLEAAHKFSQHGDGEEDMEILQRTIRRVIRRMLHPCAKRLRESAGSDAARAHAAMLHELFELDQDDPPSK
ncbi:MAG TPA: glutamyl-tRNA reductase [Phycisphaerae bacterium]|nr:glutamyl-tRNA reductase [Phycisphaerae bacterium]